MPATSDAPSAATARLYWNNSSCPHTTSTCDCSPCATELVSTLRALDCRNLNLLNGKRLATHKTSASTATNKYNCTFLFQISYPRPPITNAQHDSAPTFLCFPHLPLLSVPVTPTQHISAQHRHISSPQHALCPTFALPSIQVIIICMREEGHQATSLKNPAFSKGSRWHIDQLVPFLDNIAMQSSFKLALCACVSFD